MQDIEERFVLVHASSVQDTEIRLGRQWRKYATPYLNLYGQHWSAGFFAKESGSCTIRSI
jgi:hypothetical protein